MELKNNTKDYEKCVDEYDSQMDDLQGMKQNHDALLEEKRKRDEIAAIMQRKKDE